MGHLQFRIDGITRKRFRRFRRLGLLWGRSTSITRVGVLFAVVAVGSYAIGVSLPGFVEIFAEAHEWGHVVRVGPNLPKIIGKHAVFIFDISDSMDVLQEAEVDRQIGIIKKSKITSSDERRREIGGFGVRREVVTGRENLLNMIESIVKEELDVDIIYVFSDYLVVEDPKEFYFETWKSNPEGFAYLASVLSDQGIRLYISTVEHPPDPNLERIANESGGGVIRWGPAKKKPKE